MSIISYFCNWRGWTDACSYIDFYYYLNFFQLLLDQRPGCECCHLVDSLISVVRYIHR